MGKLSLNKLIQYAFLPLLPVFFVLHGFNEYYPIVPVSDGLLLAGQYLLVILIMTGLFYLAYRFFDKAALLAFILLASYLFFGAVQDFLKKIAGNSFLPNYDFLIPAMLVMSILLFFWLKSIKRTISKLIKYLNLLLVIITVIEIGSLVIHSTFHTKHHKITSSLSCNNCNKPDVFLIIADGYAGRKEMEQVLHFNNSLFEKQLQQRGFFIADSSISNYNYTPFSMASLFNMNFLPGLEGRNKSASDRQICYTAINGNPVVDFFRNSGYNIKNYSVFRFDDKTPLVTTTFHKSGRDLIIQHTLWGRINRDIRLDFAFRHDIYSEIARASYHERDLNKTVFENTMNEVNRKSSQPRFVYTHLSMPHYPYYFNKDGVPYPLNGLVADETQSNQERYLQYLQFCNVKLLELVDAIIANSSKPPVILLMSDHGFREFKEEDSVDHKFQFMNLNAVMLPGKDYQGFYKGMSIINQFRVVLNKEFRQQLPLLKDSCSYLTE